VDDDELATLRQRAQGVVFDLPEEPANDEPLVFHPKAAVQ
jgi:hypothetical protein